MNAADTPHRGLLPAGLSDMLPPEAAREARAMELVMGRLAAHGYQRVKPPLVEFEESLLGGPGAALSKDTFRLMDPVSQRMMGVRPDMTVQVARIAVTRLKDAARPLRLSYAGNVIRVRGSQLRPERQFAQVGAELIGPDSAEADAETVLLAVEALRAVGVANLSVDLNLPTLVTALCRALALPGAVIARLRRALERKDEDAVRRALETRTATDLFVGLLRCVGQAEPGIATLKALDLPAEARSEAERLALAVSLVRAAAPDLRLTIDPVEYRGLEYQTGVSFTFYALDTRGELGRGGRYRAGYPEDGMAANSAVVSLTAADDLEDVGLTEPATGFTLFMDTVSGAARIELPGKRLYVPRGVAWADLAQWQQDGFLTVRGLEPATDAAAEARRLDCTHVLIDGRPSAV
ncbi:ATP phosphoribosyltransferase regulatory subunit [Vineibacter terrae]|uniref:ATP phosphoribosyltransferase regulatory subunit n=1 Tax=Vineibacter terrae TaxID=2586908 RepID=UPI002E30BE81|nr:ATP phosphoribosyltransferase regulatory subunit [Vineibacter terrae]HEX2889990.1 ATP phosphoribosyltransferase regulatory subunit [Vineibacter terrae]